MSKYLTHKDPIAHLAGLKQSLRNREDLISRLNADIKKYDIDLKIGRHQVRQDIRKMTRGTNSAKAAYVANTTAHANRIAVPEEDLRLTKRRCHLHTLFAKQEEIKIKKLENGKNLKTFKADIENAFKGYEKEIWAFTSAQRIKAIRHLRDAIQKPITFDNLATTVAQQIKAIEATLGYFSRKSTLAEKLQQVLIDNGINPAAYASIEVKQKP